DYVAYNTAEGGTDSFELAVRDRLGAIGTATVTIGVIPPPSTNRSPVAAADLVHVRPDRQIQVDVLINDTDPDGDQLGFGDPAVVDDGGLEVAVEDGMLTFTSPSEEGEYTVLYKADDGHGGQDVGSLTVRVDADAPFVPPVAVDDLVPAIELLDATTVDVDVLDNDYDPDGSNDNLVVSLPVESDAGRRRRHRQRLRPRRQQRQLRGVAAGRVRRRAARRRPAADPGRPDPAGRHLPGDRSRRRVAVRVRGGPRPRGHRAGADDR